MPRDNRRARGGFIFIPQRRYYASWKVTVTNEDTDVTTDVTDYVLDLNIDWQIGRVAGATIELSNNYGKWLGYWTGGETVKVYGEYGDTDTPTTVLFNGKLDSVYFSLTAQGYKALLECRQTPELIDKKIVEQFDNALITTAIQTIVDNNYSGIVTYTGFPSTTIRYTGNFRHTTGMAAFEELAEKAGMDVFIDVNNNIELFTKADRKLETDAVSYETNLISLPRYGTDNTKLYNRIIVYGKEDQNIILLKTEEDEDSQDTLWVKDMVITDNSLSSMDEIQEKADIELSNNTNLEEEGRITILGMPDIKPGYLLTVQIPYCGVSGDQNIRRITHSFSPNGFITNLDIEDKQETIAELFRDRIDEEERLKPYNNLNNMTDSYTVFFNESPQVVTLVNAEISEERLKLEDGKSAGTCIFDELEADNNIIQCELRIVTNFPQHELCTFQVSNNGGASWETITPGTLHTFSSSGSQLRFKINLVGDSTHNPTFDMVCLLYKVA